MNVDKKKIRIAYLIKEYPQISQTYVHEEVSSLAKDFEIKIFTWKHPDLARKNPYPFEFCSSQSEVVEKIINFKPHYLHSHYLLNLPFVESIAKTFSIPYTLRSHSFDVLKPTIETLTNYCKLTQSELCKAVLCFPEFQERLIKCGIPKDKVVPCWPVVNYKRFYHPEKHQKKNKIMNVGAAIEKKNYQSFIDLAFQMKDSGNEFNLYVMGYEKDKLMAYNQEMGMPVKNITTVEPEEMAIVYQAHDWLVYTGDPEINTLGLPMALAEAQASGIGVCMQEMPGRKQALLDYLGGAGFLFKNIAELPTILSTPLSEEMRIKGLENAKKCDIEIHKHLLSKIWE